MEGSAHSHDECRGGQPEAGQMLLCRGRLLDQRQVDRFLLVHLWLKNEVRREKEECWFIETNQEARLKLEGQNSAPLSGKNQI